MAPRSEIEETGLPSVERRITALRDRPLLTQAEIQDLLTLVREQRGFKEYGEKFYWLVDEIFICLKRQSPPWPEMPDFLTEVFHDRSQPEVIRDYALQHIASMIEENTASADYMDMISEALREKNSSIAGTALLALARLQGTAAPIHLRLAHDLVSSPTASPLTSASALQYLARASDSDTRVKVLAEEIAQDPSEPLVKRVAAISALRLHGGESSRSLLQQLVKSNQPAISNAASKNLSLLDRS